MEVVGIVLGLGVLVIWFINGLLNAKNKRRDQELQALNDALKKNRIADDSLNDPDRVRRVRDRYND